MQLLLSSGFWIDLLEIIWLNIMLSGDNAVVIALAARSLPPAHVRKAIVLGSGAAVAARVLLTLAATWLMALPGLQIAGGLLLLWIGIRLLNGAEGTEGTEGSRPQVQGGMFAAMRTILLADLVMSLENVIAVAAAARGSLALLIAGLAISIPLVIFGGTLMLGLLRRHPNIVAAGAALIGWVAGQTLTGDALFKDTALSQPGLSYSAAALGALLVLVIGKARWSS